jgi:PIN domain nuclease of toxin-antitoxin system
MNVVLDRHWKAWFRHFVKLNDWLIVDTDLKVAEEAYPLPDYSHSDPADRIIIATARILLSPIVTADRRFLDYPHVDAVWRGRRPRRKEVSPTLPSAARSLSER